MTTLPLFQVDAFTDRPFGGNPAAVVPLDRFPEDAWMQAVAAENALSETAFLVPRSDGDWDLRWFTPAVEVDLCGHATLASGFVLLERLRPGSDAVRFHTKSGPLEVRRDGDRYRIDLPARPPRPIAAPAGLTEALGARPVEVLGARDVVAVFNGAEDVRALAPDFRALSALDAFAVCCTARGTGDDEDVDFVSRFFAPRKGIDEDPVTGSAHATLTPLWADRLGKRELRARQVSARGGELGCTLEGERVALTGAAVLVVEGRLYATPPAR